MCTFIGLDQFDGVRRMSEEEAMAEARRRADDVLAREKVEQWQICRVYRVEEPYVESDMVLPSDSDPYCCE